MEHSLPRTSNTMLLPLRKSRLYVNSLLVMTDNTFHTRIGVRLFDIACYLYENIFEESVLLH